MRSTMLSLLLASALAAHGSTRSEPLFMRVQSTASNTQSAMHITITGGLFISLGIDERTTGTLHLNGQTGIATGVVQGEIIESPGELTFTADEAGALLEISVGPRPGVSNPRLGARGHAVSVVRGPDGALSVHAKL